MAKRMDHLVFLTGRLAEPQLRRVLDSFSLDPHGAPFSWEVREIGLQVAALMTAEMIERRVPVPVMTLQDGQPPQPADRLIVPGRCRGDLAALSQHFGIPVQRGPEELKDLPRHFNRAARPVDLSAKGPLIFAEIVDAPRLDVAAILARAATLAAAGADVIDLGCLPDTRFEHLADSVLALKAMGYAVSVDSVDSQELLEGGRAGADYLLSLTLDTLWVADEVAATPVLIPRSPADEASLYAAVEWMQQRGKPFLADAILDPIPFGFTASIVRYHRLRERYASVPIMLGVGNLTELTEADTSGINALLFGIAAELNVAAVLTTQVSGHARRAVREADWARRIMHAAAAQRMLPKGLSDALMTTHAKHPFPDSASDIAATAAQVRDPNFRVQVAAEGLFVYNRDGLRQGQGAFALWPQLGLEGDAAHAFYMGVELANAETAWRLGKRYVQDQPLNWGCAVDTTTDTLDAWCAPGTTRPGRPAAGLNRPDQPPPEPAATQPGTTDPSP